MRSILIVDNDTNHCAVLQENLPENSYYVHSANCAGDVNEFVSAGNRADLIIMDLNLSAMDGSFVLKTLRAQKNDIKVIVHTKNGNLNNVLKSVGMGADAFFIKPYNFEELSKAIGRLI